MNKYFYNGKAIIASSKKEAIAFLASQKSSTITTASASKDIVEWICKTFAGVLEIYSIDADTEKKIFEKAADSISGILLEYLNWSDDKGELVMNAPFEPKYSTLADKCTSFEEFRNKLYEKALEEVAMSYEKVSTEVVKILCDTVKYFGINEKDANRLDLYIQDDVLERIVDNTYTEYHLEKYLDLKLKRPMYVPLETPQVMFSVFGTQDLAEVAKRIINQRLSRTTYDAIVFALRKESRNIDLDSFERVLLCFKHILSSIYIVVSKDFTVREILSSKDSTNVLATDKVTVTNNDNVYIDDFGASRINMPIRLLNPITINPKLAEFTWRG
jgi:hypothetical protein